MSGLLDAADEARMQTGFHDEVTRMVPFARLVAERHEVAARYRAAEPCPHAVLDELFDPRVLDRVAADFPAEDAPRGWTRSGTAAGRSSRGLVGVHPYASAFLWQLCSEPFLAWLREVTGIEELVADPMFHGGGLQEGFGGNWPALPDRGLRHPHLPLVRRLTLIVHLTRDWREEWGGALELRAPGAEEAAARVAPLFNRAVLFPAGSESPLRMAGAPAGPPRSPCRSASLVYWSPDPAALREGAALPDRGRERMLAAARALMPPVAGQFRDRLRSGLEALARGARSKA